MSTGINYLDDTWNPITGCTPCSPGCANCWAKAFAHRMKGMGVKKYMHDDPFAVRFHPDELDKPLHWRKPRRIGVCFMGDMFHEEILGRGFCEQWLPQIYRVMAETPRHTYFLLTKRPQNIDHVLGDAFLNGAVPVGKALPNVYHGATICTQPEADAKLPDLLKIPGKHWLSIEPMLSAIDIRPYLATGQISWVVIGCES